MMEFVTDPVVIILGPDRFKLADDFICKVYDFTIIVPADFQSDLDSVPRIPIAYMMLKNRCPRSGLLHDYLYSTGEYPRNICDSIFNCSMETEKLPAWARGLIYAGVRIGGASHYNKQG